MDKSDEFYNAAMDSFQQIIKKPSHFLQADESLCDNIKQNLKSAYDFTKKEEIKTVKSSSLPKLVVQNFDVEQIWQQLELQNESVIAHFLKKASKLVVGKNRLLFQNFEKLIMGTKDTDKSCDVDSSEEIIEEQDNDKEFSDVASENEEEPRKNFKQSVVDDEFFKMDEMEKFLQSEEKKINEPDSGNDSDESEEGSETSVGLFEADLGDEIDDARVAKYKDFFVLKEKDKKKSKHAEPQSSFELRQNRLKEKISEIEDNAIQEKHWPLKGEITAEKRPQNSLLEEVVEFDLTTRPPPVITEQTTMQLEDIIKQRIKDRVFDSVERKTKSVETPLEYKKKIVLDQEKSKESLAQIYEQEFIAKQAALDPGNQEIEEKEPELHQEINTMMKNLFLKLDALSNFHFTPKPAIPDLRIISNLPAISMEEVAPVATSEAALLAPEEVKTKMKSDIIGKGERTVTDKKRERRKKKRRQKIHAQGKLKREKIVANKYSKERVAETLKKVTKEKNVDKMDESYGDASIKSSKAFFTQLQEQVKTQIKRKSFDKADSKKKENLNAKKLKL